MTKDCMKLNIGHYIAIATLILSVLGSIGGVAVYITDTINKNIMMVNDNVKDVKQDVRVIDNKMNRHLEYHIDKNCDNKSTETKNAKIKRMAEEETNRENNPKNYRSEEDESKLFWKFRLGKSRSKSERYGVRP